MTNPHKQSAEEIVSLIISNTASQYSEEWKPDKVYTKEELIKIVESFAKQEVKKACEEKDKEIKKAYIDGTNSCHKAFQPLLKSALKEQRKECADQFDQGNPDTNWIIELIRNAPEPKI